MRISSAATTGMIFSLIALSVASCAPGITRTPITDLSKRIEFESFSILPPQGANWFFVSPVTAPYNLGFQKQLEVPLRPEPSVVALVWFRKMDDMPQDKEALLETAMRRAEWDAGHGRLRRIEFKASSANNLGASCRKYDSISEDRSNPYCPGCIYTLEVHGLICVHPRAPIVVQLQYGPRVPQGQSIPSVEQEGEAFLNSLVFK